MKFINPQKSKVMLEIKQINANEKLTDSTKLEIVCTSRDLCILKACLYMALYNLEWERIDDLKEEFKKLIDDILKFQYPD